MHSRTLSWLCRQLSRRHLLFAALAFASLGLTLHAAPASTAGMTAADSARLRAALAAYDSGRTAEAQPVLEQLHRSYPNRFDINETLGLIHAEAGDFTAATPLLERAARLQPRNPLARANLGTAYLKLEQPTRALPELEAAARLEPRNQQTLINLATAEIQTKESARATQTFAAAAALGPLDAGTTHDRAVALLDSGNAAEARRVLDAVPAVQRNDAIEAVAGETEERLGNYQAAAEHFSQAAHLNPSEPNIYAWVVELLRHFSWQPAAKVAESGIERYPDSLRMKAARGIAFYADNRYKEAASVFSELLAIQPDNATYAGLLGRSCALIQDASATGCEGLERFAKDHPQNAQAATYAATALLHRPAGQRDDATARALLQQATAADPSLADAWYQLGVLEQEQTHWQESTVPLEKAIALKPTLAEAHYRLARAYSHLGRREDAAKQIELQQRYAKEQKESLDARLKEVTTFLTAGP
jgi:tetratricopeptide (TPR) repeat protein